MTPEEEAADSLKAYCREEKRISPLPIPWDRIWKRLRADVDDQNLWPPWPLVLSGWSYSNDDEKAQRLVEQIDWAASNGRLRIASELLRSLAETDWYHSHDLR